MNRFYCEINVLSSVGELFELHVCFVIEWHQYDGISKPNWGFWKKYSAAVSSVIGSVVGKLDLYKSEYDVQSTDAALSALPAVLQEVSLGGGAKQPEPIEQILHQIAGVVHCMQNSFVTATSGDPMGAKFSREVCV